MIIDKETLIAWTKLLKYSKPVTVRGFQRLMGYSSPGKAQRILERLHRYGLVEKTSSGEYVVSKNIPPYLAAYTVIKGYVIPRSIVFGVYALATAVAYTILAKPPIHLVILLSSLVIPYWIETLHYMRTFKQLID